MKFLPDSVHGAIALAQHRLNVESEHSLRPLDRKLIYEAIADLPNGEQVRHWLEVITAEYVLSVWAEARPLDLLPQLVLRETHLFLEGKTSKDTVSTIAANLGDHLEALVDWANQQTEERYRVWYAGEAVAEAAYRATNREKWTESWPLIDEALSDEWLDALYSDTAKWASFAYAGRITDSTFEPRKRLQFWTYWLEQAVPQAFSVANEVWKS